ncbi:hypothetical protein A8A54_04450 [Brucella pseudogrignonensis]|uniref:hypothetical protein n=1 Tax=Brucella pseudogrignonensis TaxID=419475 RepID=UPI0007DA75C0|nr:hypothetical protein [Brucella pseudogrignonensis]ANG95802.1 hypothetical protein A8A54_04450 [Brucella pseudogrignonensis]
MTVKIENIRPDYDERDILTFEVNGIEYSECLTGPHLGKEVYTSDGLTDEYLLADDFEEAEMGEIHAQLEQWIAVNKDERFGYKPDHADIENIEHGLNISRDGLVVFLTDEAGERLNLSDDGLFGYEISGNGDISWTDRDFGDQYCENSPGGDREDHARNYTLSNPETAIGDIEYRLEQLREEAEEELEDEDDNENALAI